MLAENVGHVAVYLSLGITRNPGTIALTEYLRDHAPGWALEFEQDILVHFDLAPYFVAAGVVAGLCLSFSFAKYGALLPASYAIWISARLLWMSAGWFDVPWFAHLDFVLYNLALIPLYVIGVNLGRAVVERRWPHWGVLDMVIATTICGVLLFAVVRRPFFHAIPATLLIAFTMAAWRTLPGRTHAAELNGAAEPQ
jgi:hypothetical protein